MNLKVIINVLSLVVAVATTIGSRSPLLADEDASLQTPEGVITGPALAETLGYGDGEAEIVRERYPDGKVQIERQVALDTDGNYTNHGPWKMYNPAGDVVAEGQFEMGRRVGPWSRWHGREGTPALSEVPFKQFKAPFQSRATFVDGQIDGEWLIVDASQSKCMQVFLSAGKRHGTLTVWLPNGNTYRQATYEEGVPVGDVLEADGNSGQLKSVATYLDGRKITTKTAYHRGGKQKKSEEQYASTTVMKSPDDFWTLRLAEYAPEGKDLRHGPSTTWFESGVVQQEGTYQFGKKFGAFTYHHANGQLAASGEYRDDQLDDIWVWWHKNGQKQAVGRYRSGALVGDWRRWNDDGKLAVTKAANSPQEVASKPAEADASGQLPTPTWLR